MANIEMLKPHPVEIFSNIPRYFLILVVPIANAILNIGREIPQWDSTLVLSLVALVLILFFAVLRWHFFRFGFHGGKLYFSHGLFFHQRGSIKLDNLSVVHIEHSFLLKPFGVCKLSFDTDCPATSKSNFNVFASAEVANLVESFLYSREISVCSLTRVYRPRIIYLTLMSVITSNLLAGVLIFTTFFSSVSQLFDTVEFQQRLFNTINSLAEFTSNVVPPVAATVAYALLGIWGLAFFSNMARNTPFVLSRDNFYITIRQGIFTKRRNYISVDKINYLDIRQSLFIKILRIYTVFVNASGYGRRRGEVNVLIPAVSARGLCHQLSMITKSFIPTDVTSRPLGGAFWRFLRLPVFFIAVVPMLQRLANYFFPVFSELSDLATILFLAFCGWFIVLKTVAYFSSGVGVENGYVTIKYSKRLYLHTVVFPIEKIVGIEIKQSVFMKRKSQCDVTFRIYPERFNSHTVRGVSKKQVQELLGHSGIAI